MKNMARLSPIEQYIASRKPIDNELRKKMREEAEDLHNADAMRSGAIEPQQNSNRPAQWRAKINEKILREDHGITVDEIFDTDDQHKK